MEVTKDNIAMVSLNMLSGFRKADDFEKSFYKQEAIKLKDLLVRLYEHRMIPKMAYDTSLQRFNIMISGE